MSVLGLHVASYILAWMLNKPATWKYLHQMMKGPNKILYSLVQGPKKGQPSKIENFLHNNHPALPKYHRKKCKTTSTQIDKDIVGNLGFYSHLGLRSHP